MCTVGWEVAESAEFRTSLTGKKVTERGNEETLVKIIWVVKRSIKDKGTFQNWLSAEKLIPESIFKCHVSPSGNCSRVLAGETLPFKKC